MDKQHIAITVVAILFSLGWIVGAAYYKLEDTGGRGGAIAVALTFYLLFIGGNLAKRVQNTLQESSALDARISGLEANLHIRDLTTKHQNYYLFISSIVGTIAWGFGDLVAKNLPASVVSKFGLLVALGFLPPAPVAPVASETQLLRERLADFERLREEDRRILSERIEELRRYRDDIRQPLDEISTTLRGLLAPVQEIQNLMHQVAVALRSKGVEATPPSSKYDTPLPSSTSEIYSVPFGSGQIGLTAAARQTIVRVVQSAKNHVHVLCNGYSDASGNFSANQRISILRASNVAVELVRDGLEAEKITINGYGPREPATRRVEIVLQ